MERLLGGSRKQVVLLTATPINNGLWDLYNLVMLFARHDRAFAAYGIDSVRGLFLAAGANERDPENLSPDVLFPLADAVSVRRDRRFIESEYAGQQFPDGTPVRFPTPRLTTRRYDLDASHPGLLDRIADAIDGLTMARYRPSAYELAASDELRCRGPARRTAALGCPQALRVLLGGVPGDRRAHARRPRGVPRCAWERGEVPSSRGAARGCARARPATPVWPRGWRRRSRATPTRGPPPSSTRDYGEEVRADRDRLQAIRDELAALDAAEDPKLAALLELLDASPAEKIAVFATYGATVRYLDEHLPARVGGRERVVVIGEETHPRPAHGGARALRPGHRRAAGLLPARREVDLLLSTDVLSEGQNLQQAQAVISYDMPWNPQRVVQRNGRVIRLRSPHDEVLLTTMLPEPGELERLLGLEARIQAKIVAAGVYGMESEVIEGSPQEEQRTYEELRAYSQRLVDGDAELLDEGEVESGAFVGEQLRRLLERAFQEGEARARADAFLGVSARAFARPPRGARTARRASSSRCARPLCWASRGAALLALRRARRGTGGGRRSRDPAADRPWGGEPVGEGLEDLDLDLECAWQVASADVVAQHNERADLREEQQPIGPRQRWALSVLRDPGVASPPGAEEAEEALSVGRSSAVRKALGAIESRLRGGEINLDVAAQEIVEAVERFGLRPVEEPPLPAKVTVDDLGVVCWMAVLSARGAA